MDDFEENYDNTPRNYIICGITMAVMTVFFIVYVSITARRLHRKIIQMGRLIPTVCAIIVPGPIATVQSSYQQQYLNYGQQHTAYQQQYLNYGQQQAAYQQQSVNQQPPQPGWCSPDPPPAYSTVTKN